MEKQKFDKKIADTSFKKTIIQNKLNNKNNVNREKAFNRTMAKQMPKILLSAFFIKFLFFHQLIAL